jgi:hypothetical protein
MKKRILAFAVTLTLVFALIPLIAAAQTPGKAILPGEKIQLVYSGWGTELERNEDEITTTVTDDNRMGFAVRFENTVDFAGYNYLVFDMKADNAEFFENMAVFRAFVSNGADWSNPNAITEMDWDVGGNFNVMGGSASGDWPGTKADSPVKNFPANEWVTVWVDLNDCVGGKENIDLATIKAIGLVFFDQGAGTVLNFRKFGVSNEKDGSDIVWPEPTVPTQSGIDYESVTDCIITGVTFSFKNGKEIPAGATPLQDATINLTTEKFSIPAGYNIEAFSTDGGMTWKAGNVTEAQVIKMLNKGMELWLCFKDYNSNAKKPQGSGNEHNIIAFGKIEGRPAVPRLAINYEIAADKSGATNGDWVLVERGGPTAVRTGIQIGVASGRAVDERGFGQFFQTTGIPVLEARRTQYFVRTAPDASGGTFTPASRTRRINAAGLQKVPRYSVREKAAKGNNPATAIIRVRANTGVIMGDRRADEYTARTDIDVLTFTGDIQLWMNATARRPMSAKQVISRTSSVPVPTPTPPPLEELKINFEYYEVITNSLDYTDRDGVFSASYEYGAVFGAYHYSRPLTQTELNNWSHGGALFDADMNEVGEDGNWPTFYSDTNGHFVMGFPANLEVGSYTYTLYHIINGVTVSASIEFVYNPVSITIDTYEIRIDGGYLHVCHYGGSAMDEGQNGFIVGDFQYSRPLTQQGLDNFWHAGNLFDANGNYVNDLVEIDGHQYTRLVVWACKCGRYAMWFPDSMTEAGIYTYELRLTIDGILVTASIDFEYSGRSSNP